MSISRETPLGTLHIAADPVEGGDVVDFPRGREEAQESLDAIEARIAAADNELRRRAAVIRANPPTSVYEAAGMLSDAFGASVAHLHERRRPAPRPTLTVHTGGAA